MNYFHSEKSQWTLLSAILPRLDDDFDRALDINEIIKEKIQSQTFRKTHFIDLSHHFVDKNSDPIESCYRFRLVSEQFSKVFRSKILFLNLQNLKNFYKNSKNYFNFSETFESEEPNDPVHLSKSGNQKLQVAIDVFANLQLKSFQNVKEKYILSQVEWDNLREEEIGKFKVKVRPRSEFWSLKLISRFE